MTEAAIDPGLLRDFYVSLGEPLEDGAWSVRLYHKPFIDWIWGGCLIMALGGVLAISDRRYRLAWREQEAGGACHGPNRAPESGMNRFLLPLSIFIVVVGFLAVGLTLNPREMPSPLVGKAAPEFSLPQLHDPGKVISPADLKGKVWLLNFWASWCGGCKTEHPVLMDLAESGEVPIYGMDYKDQRNEAMAWLRRVGQSLSRSLGWMSRASRHRLWRLRSSGNLRHR